MTSISNRKFEVHLFAIFILAIAFVYPIDFVYAACATPTANVGSLDFQGGVFKYCDGTTWQPLGSAATTDASLLTSGILADARLSTNVAMKNAANTFTVGAQQITNNAAATIPFVIRSAASQTATLTKWEDSVGALIYGLAPGGVPIASTDIADKGYVDTSVGNYVLKAGDTMTGALVNNTNSASTALAVTQAGAGHAASFMGGNVGVGTTNPTFAALEIRRGVSDRAAHFAGGPTNAGVSIGGSATAGFIIGYGSGGGDVPILIQNNGVSGTMIGSANLPLSKVDIAGNLAVGSYAGNNAAPANGIIVSGNVGIGTSAPARLLHVAGPIRVQPAALPTGVAGDIAIDSGASNALKYYNGTAWVSVGGGGATNIDGLSDAITTANNLFMGTGVGASATGTNGTGIGISALNALTTGTDNIAVGYVAGNGITTQARNVAVGSNALYGLLNASSNDNTAVGTSAGFNNGTGLGAGNSVFGSSALYQNGGTENVALGYNTLYGSATASYSTAVGAAAGYGATGNYNSFLGYRAGYNVSGADNVAIGRDVLFTNAGASVATRNVIIGALAGSSNNLHTGADNVAIGYNSGFSFTSAATNVVIGKDAGNTLTTGSSNILLGNGTLTPAVGTSNFLNIGNAIFATGMTGTLAAPAGNVGIGTTNPTRLLHVAGPMRITPTAVPASPAAGDMYFDSASSNALKYYDGTAWQTVSSGSGTVNSGTINQLAYYAATGSAVSSAARATISSGALSLGTAGTAIGTIAVSGNTSGTVTIQPQAAAGTYNFNLPTTAGTSGYVLTSAGGAAAPMTWTQLSTSATTDATNATNISSGTLNDLRLSTNVALKNAANTFSVGGQLITNNAVGTKPLVIRGVASQTAPMQEWQNSASAVLYGLDISGVPVATTDLVTKSYVTTAVGNYVLKAGDTMTGALVNNTNSASTALAVTQAGSGYAATLMGGSVGIGTTAPAGKLEVTGGMGDGTQTFKIYQPGGTDYPANSGNVLEISGYYGSTTPNALYVGNDGVLRASRKGATDATKFYEYFAGIPTVETGFVRLSNMGASSYPAVALGGSSGLFLAATNTLAFSTNNTERARIDSTGNVGIGTISPGAPLEVRAVASTNGLRVSSATTPASYYVDLKQNDGATTLQSTNSDLFLVGGYRNSYQSSGGGWTSQHNFSTTNPITNGTGASNFLEGAATWAPTSGAGAFNPYTFAATVNQTGTASGSYTGLTVNINETAVLGTGNNLLNVQKSGTSQFIVKSSGNVGIGTTAPGASLEVAGDAKIQHLIGRTAAPTIAVGAGAGPGATASLTNATDLSGLITVNTGSPGAAGILATITFNVAYATAPNCVFSPAAATSAMNLPSRTYITTTTTTLVLNLTSGANAAAHQLTYYCTQ